MGTGETKYPAAKEPLKNVSEVVRSRQKSAKKRSLYVINEHFELIFNTKMTTQVVFQRFTNWIQTNISAGQMTLCPALQPDNQRRIR